MTTAHTMPRPAPADDLRPHRFSTDDYLQMIDAGVLGPSTKVELIGGMIVDMSPSGPPHNHVLSRLTALFSPLFDRAVPSVQGTLVVADGEVYDPDFMLLRPKNGGYKKALPRPEDVLLLIEAADSSLRKDQKVKLRVYAAAGIADYWIADVEREALTVHRQPHADGYNDVRTVPGDERVSPIAFPDFAVRVNDIFD